MKDPNVDGLNIKFWTANLPYFRLLFDMIRFKILFLSLYSLLQSLFRESHLVYVTGWFHWMKQLQILVPSRHRSSCSRNSFRKNQNWLCCDHTVFIRNEVIVPNLSSLIGENYRSTNFTSRIFLNSLNEQKTSLFTFYQMISFNSKDFTLSEGLASKCGWNLPFSVSKVAYVVGEILL